MTLPGLSQGEGQGEGGCLPFLVPGAHLGLVGTRRHHRGLGGASSAEITREAATPRRPQVESGGITGVRRQPKGSSSLM